MANPRARGLLIRAERALDYLHGDKLVEIMDDMAALHLMMNGAGIIWLFHPVIFFLSICFCLPLLPPSLQQKQDLGSDVLTPKILN